MSNFIAQEDVNTMTNAKCSYDTGMDSVRVIAGAPWWPMRGSEQIVSYVQELADKSYKLPEPKIYEQVLVLLKIKILSPEYIWYEYFWIRQTNGCFY